MKMNALYLHGLDGSPNPKKVEAIKNRYNVNVIAPHYDYRKEKAGIFEIVENLILERQIKLLIGNSMGGYISHYLSNKLNIPSVLFNPAIKSPISRGVAPLPTHFKKIEPNKKQYVLLGMNDNVVDPYVTQRYLKKNGIETFVKYPNLGHRFNFLDFYTGLADAQDVLKWVAN